MASRFRSIWGDKAKKSPSTPRTTSGTTDTESGTDGAGKEQALYALDSMYERGLVSEQDYRQRRSEIESGKINPED